MKRSVIQRLTREYLLPHLPRFVAKGDMVYRIPVDDLLVSLLFESSSNDAASFAVRAFVQPLYVPSRHVQMTFGRRIRTHDRGEWWSYSSATEGDCFRLLQQEIADQAMPILDRFREAADFVIHGRSLVSTHSNPIFLEAYAYSACRAGMAADGLSALRALEVSLGEMDQTLAYVREMSDRAARLYAAESKDEVQAQELLSEWRRVTIASLGI